MAMANSRASRIVPAAYFGRRKIPKSKEKKQNAKRLDLNLKRKYIDRLTYRLSYQLLIYTYICKVQRLCLSESRILFFCYFWPFYFYFDRENKLDFVLFFLCEDLRDPRGTTPNCIIQIHTKKTSIIGSIN